METPTAKVCLNNFNAWYIFLLNYTILRNEMFCLNNKFWNVCFFLSAVFWMGSQGRISEDRITKSELFFVTLIRRSNSEDQKSSFFSFSTLNRRSNVQTIVWSSFDLLQNMKKRTFDLLINWKKFQSSEKEDFHLIFCDHLPVFFRLSLLCEMNW